MAGRSPPGRTDLAQASGIQNMLTLAEVADLKRDFPGDEPLASPAPPSLEGDPGATEWPDSAKGEPDYGPGTEAAAKPDGPIRFKLIAFADVQIDRTLR